MPPPIAPLLAQALGLPPGQGEQALAEVVALVRQRLQAAGEVMVEGLGTFRHDGRALTFEPAEPLAEAVNHRYAGLPTVTRPGAPQAPAAARVEPSVPEPAPEEAAPVGEEAASPEEYGPEEVTPQAESVLWPSSEEAPIPSESFQAPPPEESFEEGFTEPPSGEEEEPRPDAAPEPDADLGELAEWLDDDGAPLQADQDSRDAPAPDVLDSEQADEAAAPSTDPEPTEDEAPLAAGAFVPIDPVGWDQEPDHPAPPELTLDGGPRATFLDSERDEPPSDEPLPAGDEAPADEEEPQWLSEHAPEHDWTPDPPHEPTATEEPSSEESVVAPQPESASGTGEDELDALLEGVWTPRTGPANEDHPLGPMPEDLMEDADFSVIEGVADPPRAEAPPESPPPLPPGPGAPAESAPAAPQRPIVPPPGAGPASAAPAPFRGTTAPTPPLSEEKLPRTRRRRTWVPYALGALFLLLAALTVLWWPRSTPPTTLAERPTPTAPAPAPDPLPPPEGEGTFADPEDAPLPDSPEPEPAAPPADSPLRSADGVTPARGGYTWIVASEGTRADADRVAARYRAEGYRVSVLPADVRGRTAFRVGVGQFPTAADADRSRGQLPPFAPADTWRLAL